MRTQALFISICILLLPEYGHGYSQVLEDDIICEERYPVFTSCLDSYECVLLFMDCECVPRALREILDENDPDKGHTLCLYADLILGLGAPSCCLAQKRALIQRFEDTITSDRQGNLAGQTSRVTQRSSQEPTSATTAMIKRTGEHMLDKNKQMKNRVQTLINSALWNKEQNENTNTPKDQIDRDDKILQNLYRYLRHYIVRKKKLNYMTDRNIF